MALFSDEKKESMKQDIERNLAQIGGFGAGAGTGLLAQMKVDARYQDNLFRNALRESYDKERALEHWRTLLKLHKGQITLEDIPLEQRSFYERKLAEEASDLKAMARSPLVAKQSLDELNTGRVVPLFGSDKSIPMTRNYATKVHSPRGRVLPPLFGVAGALGAGKAYDYFAEKEPEE